MKKIIVVGTGNSIMGDDGIGLHILDRLNKYKLPANVQTHFIGTNCWSLDQAIEGFDYIVIVDGVDISGEEGESYFIPANELPRKEQPLSLHDISWLEILRMRNKLKQTFVFGIQSKTINLTTELSPTLKRNLAIYTEKLYQIITSNYLPQTFMTQASQLVGDIPHLKILL